MKNERHSDFLHEVYTQINEYFEGKREQFDVPLKCEGTPFQQSVWRQLQKIPYGGDEELPGDCDWYRQ